MLTPQLTPPLRQTPPFSHDVERCCGAQYSQHYPIHVICHIYNSIGQAPEPGRPGQDGLDLAITFADAGRAIRSAVEVDLSRLASQCEVFYITADLPHGKYRTNKWKAVSGWEAKDTLEAYFMRPKL